MPMDHDLVYLVVQRHPRSTLFPYTTLFRSTVHRFHLPPLPGTRTAAAPAPGSQRQPCAPAREQARRSEEHTSELQSHSELVCRLLLEKKKTPVEQTRTRLVR